MRKSPSSNANVLIYAIDARSGILKRPLPPERAMAFVDEWLPTSDVSPASSESARYASSRRGRVANVITTSGPEPADDRRHPIDDEHDVERQLRPTAEPVPGLLGQDFADVSGSRKQLSLF